MKLLDRLVTNNHIVALPSYAETNEASLGSYQNLDTSTHHTTFINFINIQ